MKLFFATIAIDPAYETPLDRFRELSRCDRFRQHAVVENAADADLIFFVDAHQHPNDLLLKGLRSHPLMLRYRHKCLVYDERDRTLGTVPGLYVSMPCSHFDARIHRACAYYTLSHQYEALPPENADLLFSFLGGPSHPVRTRLSDLRHPRAVLELSSTNFFSDESNVDFQRQKDVQRQRFNDLMLRSKFVLCPRGHGSSSIRLFETLACGRVPVIISDEWVAPPGADWESCSFRVRESEIDRLPQLLEAQEPRFENMAQQARIAYEMWFAPQATFHRFAEMGSELLESGATQHSAKRLSLRTQLRLLLEQQVALRKYLGSARGVLRRTMRSTPKNK